MTVPVSSRVYTMLGLSVGLHALVLATVHQPALVFAKHGAWEPLEIELTGDPAPQQTVAARRIPASPTAALAPTDPSARATAPATDAGAQSGEALVQARSDVAGLNNPKPAYPLAARRRGIQGRVLILAHVRADGACAEVRLNHSSGHALLDQSALDAVRRWRFVPARRGDVAVDSWVEVPVSFRLES